MAQRKPPDDYDGKIPLENPKWELFCNIFTTNTLPRFWGNGMNSYMFAFGHDVRIQELNQKIEAISVDGKKKNAKNLAKINALRKQIESIQNGCRSSAPPLLLQPSIKRRCAYLMDQLASHLIVDRELLYIIQQRDDLDVKARAIEHHDRRETRIREKVDIKHEFEPIEVINIAAPAKK